MVVKEQYEGAESREFWEGLGHQSRVADRSLYHSLAEQPKENRFDHTARLFHLTSWTGQFRADEVAPSSRYPQLPCPYPFVQVTKLDCCVTFRLIDGSIVDVRVHFALL